MSNVHTVWCGGNFRCIVSISNNEACAILAPCTGSIEPFVVSWHQVQAVQQHGVYELEIIRMILHRRCIAYVCCARVSASP